MIDLLIHAVIDYLLNTPGAYVRYLLYMKKRSLHDLKNDYVVNSTVFLLFIASLSGIIFIILEK